MTGRRNRFIAGVLLVLAAAIAWSWFTDGVVFQLLRDDVRSKDQVEVLRSWFADFGPWAPCAYALMVTVEVVVAPLPGLMLYAPGGILFGTLVGGGMALAGNIMGAGIACWLARSLGSHWLKGLASSDRLQRIQQVVKRRGLLLIFLLRLNPLTSSDLVSWAAGLTAIPVWKVMLATGAGMAPLCFGQAWLAEGLLDAFPRLIYPLIVCCVCYVLVVLLVFRNILRQPA